MPPNIVDAIKHAELIEISAPLLEKGKVSFIAAKNAEPETAALMAVAEKMTQWEVGMENMQKQIAMLGKGGHNQKSGHTSGDNHGNTNKHKTSLNANFSKTNTKAHDSQGNNSTNTSPPGRHSDSGQQAVVMGCQICGKIGHTAAVFFKRYTNTGAMNPQIPLAPFGLNRSYHNGENQGYQHNFSGNPSYVSSRFWATGKLWNSRWFPSTYHSFSLRETGPYGQRLPK